MTATPHDALFKTIFGKPEDAAGELQHLLPGRIAARIDWASLAPEPGSYVDEQLATQHSDLLFSARSRTSDEPVLVYLLFEHQSTPEPLMALRLLGYMVRIWTRYAKENPGKPLPVIVPAVLAQVPGGWTAATRFADLFAPTAAALSPGVLPDFTYFVDDLHRVQDQDLQRRALSEQARLGLWLMRDARDTSVLLQALADWAPALEALANGPHGHEALTPLFRYIALVSVDLRLSDFRAKLRATAPTAEGIAMTLAEQLRSEGLAQGKAEGKAEAVLVLLRARAVTVPAAAEQRIRACTESELLDRWLVLAPTVTHVRELFEA